MTTIADNLKEVISTLEGTQARLVAVSKYHPIEALQQAYDAGQRIFGESHVQELAVKQPALPDDIQWHFIGHLQTNKVKYIAPYISLIHSVDSEKLLREIDKQATKANRTIDCLLQIHIAQEETKFGFLPEELTSFLNAGTWKELTHTRIRGLMCMATNTDDDNQIAAEFKQARQLFETTKQQFFSQEPSFTELSMGMSDDYPIAVSQGSTLVRVGSKIFGTRIY